MKAQFQDMTGWPFDHLALTLFSSQSVTQTYLIHPQRCGGHNTIPRFPRSRISVHGCSLFRLSLSRFLDFEYSHCHYNGLNSCFYTFKQNLKKLAFDSMALITDLIENNLLILLDLMRGLVFYIPKQVAGCNYLPLNVKS